MYKTVVNQLSAQQICILLLPVGRNGIVGRGQQVEILIVWKPQSCHNNSAQTSLGSIVQDILNVSSVCPQIIDVYLLFQNNNWMPGCVGWPEHVAIEHVKTHVLHLSIHVLDREETFASVHGGRQPDSGTGGDEREHGQPRQRGAPGAFFYWQFAFSPSGTLYSRS